MSSEQAANGETSGGKQALVAVADPSLSLKPRKLAGSEACLNCGTALKGPFCYFCGQPDRNFMRFFPVLLRDMMEDLLDLDSRFIRTMKPLLFKPGRLTRDYMEGRRFRYAPPMRLYIFSSIIFFLLAALLSSDSISVISDTDESGSVQIVEAPIAKQEQADVAQSDPTADTSGETGLDATLVIGEDGEVDEALFKLDDISFNDEPWDRETNPVDIKWLSKWLNDRINDEIEGSPQKAEQINDNPNLIIDKVFDVLPATMFVLLPVVALIFKFWYLFAKRYYIEHLIFSLHNHAFLFVSLILILLAILCQSQLAAHDNPLASDTMGWLAIGIGMWIPVYMLISLRVVYRQNWLMTAGKYVMLGISYLTLLGFVTIGVAVASFVLL